MLLSHLSAATTAFLATRIGASISGYLQQPYTYSPSAAAAGTHTYTSSALVQQGGVQGGVQGGAVAGLVSQRSAIAAFT